MSLIPEPVLRMLTDVGITLVGRQHGGGDRAVDLTVAVPGRDTPLSLAVKAFDRPVTPKLLDQLSEQSSQRRSALGLLVISPSASHRVRELAVERGISLIALNSDLVSGPEGHLAFAPGDVVALGRGRGPDAPSPHRRRSWGTSLVLRGLLLDGIRTQREIAELVGVSQPWVSQVIAGLAQDRLVQPARRSRVAGGWLVRDWMGLLHRWLALHQGPGGITTFWYGLGRPERQAFSVVADLRRRQAPSAHSPDTREGSDVLLSGDVAADLLAPWARPRRAVVHTRVGAELTSLGLTPSPPEHATLALVVAEDPGVWAFSTVAWRPEELGRFAIPLADPLQVLWDLRASPGPDSNEAASHFIAWLQHRFRRQPSTDERAVP